MRLDPILNLDVFSAVGGSCQEAHELAALGVQMAAAAWFRSSGGSQEQALELTTAGVDLWDAGRLLRAGLTVEQVLVLARDHADLYVVAANAVPRPRAA